MILITFHYFLNLKNRPGGHGGPHIFSLSLQILLFCDLKPHAKFHNPTITPSGRKVTEAEEEREREEKKNAVNSGHLVP